MKRAIRRSWEIALGIIIGCLSVPIGLILMFLLLYAGWSGFSWISNLGTYEDEVTYAEPVKYVPHPETGYPIIENSRMGFIDGQMHEVRERDGSKTRYVFNNGLWEATHKVKGQRVYVWDNGRWKRVPNINPSVDRSNIYRPYSIDKETGHRRYY